MANRIRRYHPRAAHYDWVTQQVAQFQHQLRFLMRAEQNGDGIVAPSFIQNVFVLSSSSLVTMHRFGGRHGRQPLKER